MLTKFSSWFRLFVIVLIVVVPTVLVVKKPAKTLVDPIPDLESMPTIKPILTTSPIASVTASITLSPTASITATPIVEEVPENNYSSEDIQGFLKEYSDKYGLDIDNLRHVVVCESGFDPLATNSVYAGLFQFDERTWITYREMTNEDPDPKLRFDAKEAVKTGSYLISIGKTSL